MRNTRCPFCNRIFNDKHEYCHHIAMKHNDQVPDEYEPLEFAYSLLVHKPIGRLCLMCRKNPVHFNRETLKYERLCENPACKDAYVHQMKERMVKVYGKEHLLNDAEMQRKMIHNHPQAKDYVWDDKHKFRVIGTYEVDFLNKLKSLDWSPDDIIAPSPIIGINGRMGLFIFISLISLFHLYHWKLRLRKVIIPIQECNILEKSNI